jgi:hypothetical protein
MAAQKGNWLARVHCKTAEAFLNAIHPGQKRWAPDPHRWMFRGQADASWKLYPSAFRQQSWNDIQ